MPPIIVAIFRILPWVLMVMLVGLNLWVFVLSPGSELNDEGVWTGEPLSGKPLALTELVEDKVVAPPKNGREPAPGETKETTKSSEAPLSEVMAKTPSSEPPPVKLETSASEAPPGVKKAFTVQAGSFILDQGVDSLMERLREKGMKPYVETVVEPIRLNAVQAGPYKELEDAREAEARLKAAGMAFSMEKSGGAFIISLSQSPLLRWAVEDLDKARDLGVKMLRVVKVGVNRPVKKVLVGPFATESRAEVIRARVEKLGGAVPIVREWRPP